MSSETDNEITLFSPFTLEITLFSPCLRFIKNYFPATTSILTLLPTAFYDFLSYGGGGGEFLSHTPENNDVKIIWLVWNLVHIINGIRLLKMRNFRKFAILFLEIWHHKIRLFTMEWFIAFRCLPPEFVFNDAKITFLLSKMIFLT